MEHGRPIPFPLSHPLGDPISGDPGSWYVPRPNRVTWRLYDHILYVIPDAYFARVRYSYIALLRKVCILSGYLTPTPSL